MRERRIVLAGPIVDELQPWIRDPRDGNPGVHSEIVNCLAGKRSDCVRLAATPSDPIIQIAGVYYHNVLGIRKHSLDIARMKLEDTLGRTATAQEVSNYCQQTLTPRGQLLGRQGLDSKIKAHLYNDEWLVVWAIFHAICTGEEVTVLTSDEAVLDQFWKAIDLIHSHYFAMAFADQYAANPSMYVAKDVKYPEKGVFVNDDATIVQKPRPLSYDLFPPRACEVQIHCMLLQRGWTRISYCAEIDMRRLLEIKGRTGGLNTENFDGRNCHWFQTVKGIQEFGDTVAIGHDVIAPDRSVRLCATDLELSIDSYIQSKPIKYVAPADDD
jgi:hypothetical protein